MKKHLHNSLRALFLSLAVLLSLPMLAVEVEIDGIGYDLNAETNQAAVIYGKAGEVFITEYLVYEGNTYSVTSIGEWAFYNCSGLTSVTIGNNVTSIGEYAFYECSGLTSVTIGNSVTSIGDWAFCNCSSLTSVTIPNSVTSIGYAAFGDCSGLTSVTIGNSVTSIGESAFSCCSGLTSVTIGNSVTSIGENAFAYCPELLDVYCYAEKVPSTESDAFNDSYPENATLHVPTASLDTYRATAPWSSFGKIVAISTEVDVINYDFDAETKQATVIAKSSGKYSGEVVIPESVEHEGTAYSVTSIGDHAFYYCSGLTSVTISDIAAWCNIDFAGYNSNPLSYAHHLYLNGEEVKDLVIPNSVTSIGYSAFSGCSGLTSVTIGNSVTSIGSYAFNGCSGLTSVTIGNSVTSIGEGAFYNCSGLTSVTIPNSVTSIGSSAFLGCKGLASVTIPNSVTSIGSSAFEGCSGLTSVTIGNSVKSIWDYAFRNCSGLTSVTIPNSVESIGSSAFSCCSGLTSVTIGNSVKSIGSFAFRACSELLDVYCYAEKVPSTESDAFEGSYPENATLHVPTASLDTYRATAPWSSFGKIVAISTEVDVINYDFDAETKQATVIAKSSGKYSGEVVIPESVEHEGTAYSVTSIGYHAFYYCKGLTSVTIPNSVESIGSSAFSCCSGLTSVTIGNSVKSIGDDAFDRCSGLTSVHIYDIAAWCNIDFGDGDHFSNPLYYAHHLYLNGEEVKDLVIPNSVTSIGDCAFDGCSGLTSVTIPNSVTSIGNSAFSGCSGLTSVTIGNSVTSIGEGAFYNCSGLTSVTIPNSVTSIGSSAFHGCKGLASVTIPNSVTSIGEGAFASCFGLTSVTIPNSVTSIGNSAFSYCSGLTSVTIPNSVTSIGNYAFEGCSGLTSVTIGNSVKSIGEWAFYYCSELLDVYCYAEKVPSTGYDVFGFGAEYPSNVTLHVPAASIGSYKATEPWKWFGKIVALTPEETGIDELKGENGKVKTALYDLSGRRVQKGQKGIFISDGKVMVR